MLTHQRFNGIPVSRQQEVGNFDMVLIRIGEIAVVLLQLLKPRKLDNIADTF